MTGLVAALFRHPIKGFTPEALARAQLGAGQPFPGDRLYAVETQPTGFDIEAPEFIPKTKFAVLATHPALARIRTQCDEAVGRVRAQAPDGSSIEAQLDKADGRAAFASWLHGQMGGDPDLQLRLLSSGTSHRFMDHPLGQVSVVNLASVRDLGDRLGVELDPLRFRANVYVEGWPAWVENDLVGSEFMLGWARARVFKPIVRCAATHANPTTGEADIDLCRALFEAYGHMFCGVYVHVTSAGVVSPGDACTLPARPGE